MMDSISGGMTLRKVKTCGGNRMGVAAVVALPNCKLATGGMDRIVRIWDVNDVRDGNCIGTLVGHKNFVASLAVLLDGRLISGSFDNSIVIWDLNKMRFQSVISQHNAPVFALAVLDDGARFASGSGDKSIMIWNIETLCCEAVLCEHSDTVFALAEIPDKNLLASGSNDCSIKLWDILPGSEHCYTCIASLNHSGAVYFLSVSLDGRLISCGKDETIKVWDVDSRECFRIMTGHTSEVTSVAMMCDSNIVISGSQDTTLKLWDLNKEDDCCIATLNGHRFGVLSVAGLPDGRIASGSTDSFLKLWSVEFPELIFK